MPSILDFLTHSVIPRSITDPVLNAVAQPGLNTSPTEAKLRGFLAGGTQGALDYFTNPLALTGGVAGGILSKLARSAKGAEAAAPLVTRIVRAAPGQRTALAVDDLDAQIEALTQAVNEGESLSNSMASGPFWVSGSVDNEVEPLRQQLKALQVIKASRLADAEAEAKALAQSKQVASEANKLLTTPLQVVQPQSAAPAGAITAEETDALAKELLKRLGLSEQDIPKVINTIGSRTSDPTNIYKK